MVPIVEEFIKILKDKTPKGTNTVDMLMDIIPMSKEAAYRRLRGQIDFSFEEVIKIAQQLDISLDRLICPSDCNSFRVSFTNIKRDNFMDDYICWADRTLQAMRHLRTYPEHYAFSINNQISILYLFKYPLISKLRVYKWMYQQNAFEKSVKLSDFVIPSQVITLEKQMLKELYQTKLHFIYHQQFMSGLVSDINYFRRLNLLSEDEVNLMKSEAFSLLDDMRHDAVLGKNREMPCTIYVTNMHFDNDFILWHSNEYQRITFRLFGINHYTVDDPKAIVEMENLINLLLKTSTQISFSGEKHRMEFFQRQREALNVL